MSKGYGQFCPVAKASEIVAERWTPLVLRELLCASTTFNDLKRGVPLMSRSLLSKRLKELERAGVVERRPDGKRHTYHLTEAGEELRPIIMQFGVWGQRWARDEIDRADLDPRLLLWDMGRSVNTDQLPENRVVVEFRFSDVAASALRRNWLVCERPEVDVCYKDPGYPVDLLVSAKLEALIGVWMGDFTLKQAVDDHTVGIAGPKRLVAAFPKWLALSGFAGVERPVHV